LTGFVALCLFHTVEAARPVWIFTPLTATTLSVPSSDTALVQYQVTNQSTKTRTLSMQYIPGVTQLTTGPGVCDRPFTLKEKEGCTLSLEINGSLLTQPIEQGPIVCENNSKFLCYRPARDNNLHVTPVDTGIRLIRVSPVSGSASGGTGVTLTGVGFTAANIVLTFGEEAATSVHVVDSTTVTAVTPAHAEGAVDVTISTSSGSATATNGYTYETTAVGQSAYGGTIACLNGGLNNLIAATKDLEMRFIWGGSGISTGAISGTDGATNTSLIVEKLGAGEYAAGVCYSYEIDSQGNTPCRSGNTCYNDWFLPAVNESNSGQLNCLYDNKNKIGDFSNSFYWSSTEDASQPAFGALRKSFDDGWLETDGKNGQNSVRCVRAFVP